jgi:hypothetical protein
VGQTADRCPFCSALNALDAASCAECGHAMKPAGRAPFGVVQLVIGVAIGCAAAAALAPAPPRAPATIEPAVRAPVKPAGGLELPADALEPGGAQDAVLAEAVEKARKLLVELRHPELDEMFRELRDSRRRLNDGVSMLAEVHRGLAEPVDEKSETQWKMLVDQLRGWTKVLPKSAAAHSSLAYALTAWGWHARGSGFADTVTDEGQTLFRSRLEQAAEACTTAAAVDPKAVDPYFVWLRLGTGLGYERTRMEGLAASGLALDPDAFALHRQMVVYLLPRWFGEPGDWQEYAARAGKPDEALYARIVTAAAIYEKAETLRTVSWARVVKGMRKLVQRHPTSSTMTSRLAWWAWLAEDRMVAKAAFTRLGDRYENGIWRTRKQFEQVRRWAMQ